VKQAVPLIDDFGVGVQAGKTWRPLSRTANRRPKVGEYFFDENKAMYRFHPRDAKRRKIIHYVFRRMGSKRTQRKAEVVIDFERNS
jgi:hypothetical protein